MAFGNFRFLRFTNFKKTCFSTFLIVFAFFQFSFSQKSEDKMYAALDVFTSKPEAESLEHLVRFEKKIVPKIKADFLAVVILKCNIAYYQNQFGQQRNAICSYENAWQMFDMNQLSNYDITEYCLKPLGNLYAQTGDFENAENTIKNYFSIATTTNNENQKISAIQNLAVVYQSSGRTTDAIVLLQNALKTEVLNPTQKASLLANLGTNYLLSQQYEPAKIIFLRAAAIASKTANGNQIVCNSYRNLASIFANEKRFDVANSYFLKAKVLFFKNPSTTLRDKSKWYFEAAQLDFYQNKFTDAQKNCDASLQILLPNYLNTTGTNLKKFLYPETLLMDGLELQATIFLKQNQYEKALQFFDLSFEVAVLIQETLVYENSKIILQIETRTSAEKYLDICEILFQKTGKILFLEKALQRSEANKRGVLRHSLHQKKVLSKTENVLLAAIQNQKIILEKEQQKGDNANFETITSSILRQNQLMLLLKSKRQKGIVLETIFDMNLVCQKAKEENALLISYFCGAQKTYCFTIQNQQLQLKSFLNSKELLTTFLNYFSESDNIANDVVGFSKTSKLVCDYLQLPTQSRLKKWIIFPDGILNCVPFEALISKKSATTNFDKMIFLVREFQISYQNSVGMYLQKTQQNKFASKKQVLGIFPFFEKSAFELPNSQAEMQAIKSNFEGIFLDKKNATFANFKLQCQQFSILHLCTHASAGSIDEPASIRFFDRTVSYTELYNLKLNADLVVLSACETGLGKWFWGEGAMSVSRGFEMAGAKNVLCSLWKVNDYSTAKIMDLFYKNIKDGATFSKANQNAKLAYLNDTNSSNAKKSPYYWAAMTYYGGINSGQKPSDYWRFGIVVVLIVMFGLQSKKV